MLPENSFILLLLIFSYAVAGTWAKCECGYRTSDGFVYTDYLETDFSKVSNVSEDNNWATQAWTSNTTSVLAIYNRTSALENAYIANGALNLVVSGLPNPKLGDIVKVGEVMTTRDDMLYGSFRASISTSRVNGTCAGFFFYRDDQAEIDIELLSKDGGRTVHFEVQPNISASTYHFTNLNFDTTADFHEYRMDWGPKQIDMYVDSVHTHTFTTNVPTVGGHLILNHWANGDPTWSAGPPIEDAIMRVRYVKAYFNSSNPDIRTARASNCSSATGDSICVNSAPGLFMPSTYWLIAAWSFMAFIFIN